MFITIKVDNYIIQLPFNYSYKSRENKNMSTLNNNNSLY